MIKAAFNEMEADFHAGFCETDGLGVSFGEVIAVGSYPWYKGEYVVTPEIGAQTLSTKETSMRENLTVKAIPYYEVSNIQNGKTVIIGGN